MTKGTQIQPHRTKRWGVAEAKSRLSEVLREAAKGPAIIHSRGRDLAVVLAIEDYERLISGQESSETGGASFLRRVEELKERHGGGVSDFEPPRLEFVPAEPFARRRRAGRS